MRLKAAEANLERLRDVIGQIGTQLANLRKQARQAQKYKELTAELRKLEAIQHYQQYSSANAAVQSEEAQLMNSLRAVGQLTQAEAAALRVQAENADALEPLREEEATRAAVLHRIQVERETLDREEKRALEREAELKARLVQIQNDAEREDQAIAEAREILARFDREEEAIKEQGDGSEGRAEAAARAEAMLEALNDADAALSALTANAAELRAGRRQFESQIAEHNARASRFAAQEAEIARQLADLRAKNAASSPVETLREEMAEVEAQLESIEEGIVQAEETVAQSRTKEKDTRDVAAAARLKAKSLETEVATLIRILKAGRGGPLQAHRGPNLGDAGLRNRAWRGTWRRSRRDRRSSGTDTLVARQRHRGRPCLAPGRRASFRLRPRPAGAFAAAGANRRRRLPGRWRWAERTAEPGPAPRHQGRRPLALGRFRGHRQCAKRRGAPARRAQPLDRARSAAR